MGIYSGKLNYECDKTEFLTIAATVLMAKDCYEYVKLNCNTNVQANDSKIILLAKNKYNGHIIQLIWDVGDVIDLYIAEFKTRFSVIDFYELCNELSNSMNELIGIENFDVRNYASNFLAIQMPFIVNTIKIEDGKVRLGSLRVYDDEGVRYLSECNRVKALCGEIDINATRNRESNYYGQSNENRLLSAMDFVKKHGYPYKDSYISVIKGKNIILDGWHRAACLYYLYGDIEVDVKFYELKDGVVDKCYFPVEKLPLKSRIVLYGAGENGMAYYEQIKGHYELIAWCDRNFRELKQYDNQPIIDPSAALSCVYDYVVITVKDEGIEKEIINWLVEQQKVDIKRIITP